MTTNKKDYGISLFIFRRDLRLDDNTALIEALTKSEQVIPCFIIDPRQVGESNKYKGEKLLQFMYESLVDLDEALSKHNKRLFYFYGEAEQVIEKLLKEIKPGALFVNSDYTIFSQKRDAKIKSICETSKTDFVSLDDALLCPPGSVLKDNKQAYTVYTPFYRKALSSVEIRKPKTNKFTNFYSKPIKSEISDPLKKIKFKKNNQQYVSGGRTTGLQLLKSLKNLGDYKDQRNFPAVSGTSKLSPHHKFGTISIRETYHYAKKHFGQDSTFISELYWRDFFSHIAFFNPHVFKGSFRKEYDNLDWENDKRLFDFWCQGQTGFPIVDAGMRELLNSGFMHNRVRMIVASFLTKDLLISWRWGERWFAKHLLDYDPAVNNGNWQWAASTGCDAQPYFRIFNPWLQQKKFDPDCEYIKKWVPELRQFSAKQIHGLLLEKNQMPAIYPCPIVDHDIRRDDAIDMFKEVKN
ncbi:MAG: deoxyribodipyrimidine photo-lyase [Bdellovibrionales bacterium]|nr:deoxyribodipyrimidine photo-lyase [Bdellovibrionales bacterium]